MRISLFPLPTILALLLVMAACTGEPAPTPTIAEQATPTPTATTTAPPTSTLASTPTPDLAPQVQELAPVTSRLRGLEPIREVPHTFLMEEKLKEKLLEILQEDYPPQEAQIDQEVLALLDLLDENVELHQLLIALYQEQVLGFYDADDGRMYVKQGGEGLGPLEKFTYVHEFTHALQDQHFGIGSLLDDAEQAENSDRLTALQSLVEGDATMLSGMYAQQELTPADIEALVTASATSPQFDTAPSFIKQTFIFPYESGLEFVSALLFRGGGWQVINDLYARPPQSTEHILHPDSYFSGDNPVDVDLSGLEEVLNDTWVRQDSDVLGELGLRLMLETFVDRDRAVEAAAGWGGDRYVYFKDGAQRQLLALGTAWDTSPDADEFFDAYLAFVEDKSQGLWTVTDQAPHRREWETPGGRVVLLLRTGDRVLIVLSPDSAAARLVAQGF